MGSIVVVHQLEGGYRRRWVFEWHGRDVVLLRYHLERREGKGHRLVEFFDGQDAGDYGNWKWLEESEVPWDEELQGEVGLAIISRLRIRRPSESRDG
jgi:hypothetical protein